MLVLPLSVFNGAYAKKIKYIAAPTDHKLAQIQVKIKKELIFHCSGKNSKQTIFERTFIEMFLVFNQATIP